MLDVTISHVSSTAYFLNVRLSDGRKLSVPIDWFPRLRRASRAQRADYVIIAAGHGIHWPQIDEDLSVDGLLRGQPAPGA